MKYLLILLFIIPTFSFGQKITKDEKDEFTGSHIKETSWISLIRSSTYVYTRFKKIDNQYTFDFKLMYKDRVFSVDKGDKLLLKFSDDSIMELINEEYKLTGIGEGATGLFGSKALGIYLKFSISKENLEKMKNLDIIKMRLYSSEGEINATINPKRLKLLKKQCELIL